LGEEDEKPGWRSWSQVAHLVMEQRGYDLLGWHLAPSSGCSSSAYPARSGEGRSGCGCTRASTATAPSGSSFGWPSPLPSSTPAEESTRTTSSALYPGRHGPRGGPRRGGILDVGEDARGNKRKEKNRKRWSLSLDESRRSQSPTKSGVTGTALHKNR
jgi:hypothetical protein